MWEPRRLTTLWVSTACYRDSFTFFIFTFFLVRGGIKYGRKLSNEALHNLKFAHNIIRVISEKRLG
jgi:hypothetical protein